MKFGNAELKNGVLLAPMAGMTDHAFRVISRRAGVECAVSEMISAKAIHYHDRKTTTLAATYADDAPIALQLFGHEPEIMAEAAEALALGTPEGLTREVVPVAIDVNMGCPMHKIVQNGDGSALARDPGRVYDVIAATVEGAAKGGLPVTVKIRAGWDDGHINAVDVAKAAERAGACAVTVHGRTKEQMYRPGVDRTIIRAVKESVSIPVIGNGDLFSADDAVFMMRETGCDGVMIARGAIGNPFLFEELITKLENRDYAPPSHRKRMETAVEQIAIAVEEKGETVAVRESRRYLTYYLRGFRDASVLRAKINEITTFSGLRDLLLHS